MKSSISKAQTHEDIGEYWGTHDLAEHWDETNPAEFEVDIKSEVKIIKNTFAPLSERF